MKYLGVFIIIALSGCVQVPRNELATQRTKNAADFRNDINANGSIYQTTVSSNSSSLSMFEDSRPNRVGDLIIVDLKEDFSASHSASTSDEKPTEQAQTTEAPAPSFWDWLFGKETTDSSQNPNNLITPSPSDASAKNAYNGTIAVTVSKVLPNGNLEVSGERKITISRGAKVLRFSGVINPRNIDSKNTITSSLIANAQVEYVDDVTIVNVISESFFTRLWRNISSSFNNNPAQ